MSHKPGTYLGGIRSIQDLRARCVIDGDCDCWHLLKTDGSPLPEKCRQNIWVHGVGYMTAMRAAWHLSGQKKPIKRGLVMQRACDSFDCVNPDHLRWGSRHTLARLLTERGVFNSAARRASIAKFAAARPQATVVTPELRIWLAESQQTGAEAAHGLGVSKGRADVLRRQMRQRPNSVFTWAASA